MRTRSRLDGVVPSITVPPCHGSCTGGQWEVRPMDGAACRCKNEEQLAKECAEGVAAAVAWLQPHFRRPEAHGHAADYLRGLIAEVERKNGWQLAERVGYAHPRGIQRVLDR